MGFIEADQYKMPWSVIEETKYVVTAALGQLVLMLPLPV